MRFTLEESMAELSELAGTAGLEVAGSTYQRVLEPNPRTYIGTGKVRLLRGLQRGAAGVGDRQRWSRDGSCASSSSSYMCVQQRLVFCPFFFSRVSSRTRRCFLLVLLWEFSGGLVEPETTMLACQTGSGDQ